VEQGWGGGGGDGQAKRKEKEGNRGGAEATKDLAS